MIDISLVIPTYNRRLLLKRALKSVVGQTCKPVEIIVVDDGSTDDTAGMVKKEFPEIVYIHQQNSGVSAARNLGIENASHDWIAFLDSDDEWLPDKLALQASVIDKNPDETYLVHGNEIWIRNGIRVNQMDKHKKYGGWIFQHCLPICAISPSSVLIKKSLLYEAGLFDEQLPACEDYDMWLKISARYPVSYLPKPLIKKYGGHDDQLSRKYWGMDRFRIRALINLLAGNILTSEQTTLVLAQLQKNISIYLNGAIKRGKSDEIKYYSSLRATYANEKYCPWQLVS